MFASTARVAQERNYLSNMRLEDEGRKELDSEFVIPVPKRFVKPFYYFHKRGVK
jgi:hypothetical protein